VAEAESDPEKRLFKAVLEFCLYHEMTASLADFFVRRTGLLYFDIRQVLKHQEWVSIYMQQFFGWTDDRRMNELKQMNELLSHARLDHHSRE
jgi:glycerol-3-phosphate dehydrogenase